jgi:integrase
MPKLNFTVKSLAKLTCPAGADRVYHFDTKTPGLAVCITAAGSRTFYVYRRVKGGRPVRYRLGKCEDLSIEQARDMAAERAVDYVRGIDPMAAKRKARASMTLAELLNHYLESHAKHHKRTWQDDEAQFNRYFGKPEDQRKEDDEPIPFPGWRNRKVNTITEADVKALHAKLGTKHGKYAANRMLALLSSMFNNAKLDNPAKGVKKFKEQQRERFLQADELPRFFAALQAEPNETIRDFILICLLTGARRSNVQAMKWSDVNLQRGTWTIAAEEAKAGDALTVHLPARAIAILSDRKSKTNGSPYVFASYGRTGHLAEPKAAWKALLERAGIEDLRIHDLRRTLGSWQAAMGASLPIIGKTLGHKNVATTAIYSRLNIDPVRQSVDAATAAMLTAGGVMQLDDQTTKAG